jgi:hypothetical protein
MRSPSLDLRVWAKGFSLVVACELGALREKQAALGAELVSAPGATGAREALRLAQPVALVSGAEQIAARLVDLVAALEALAETTAAEPWPTPRPAGVVAEDIDPRAIEAALGTSEKEDA